MPIRVDLIHQIKNVPWWAKIAGKIILSRLPVNYQSWQGLGLFLHGHMDQATYALNVFDGHVRRVGLEGHLSGKVVLELGPGDSVSSAVIAKAYRARAILADAGAFARQDLTPYSQLVAELKSLGLDPPDIGGAATLGELLTLCEARYITNGVEGLRSVPAETVDLIYSQAVLEHVRKHDFLGTLQECYRILKPSGVCSHRVDLRDHLGGGLNNLRFSSRLWESEFFAGSGFYTNRIQFGPMLDYFRQAGFEVEVTDLQRWDALPIQRRKLLREFRDLPDDALNVSGFDVLLRKPQK